MNLNLSYSPETTNSGQNLQSFLSHVTLKFDGWPEKDNMGTSSMPLQALCIIS